MSRWLGGLSDLEISPERRLLLKRGAMPDGTVFGWGKKQHRGAATLERLGKPETRRI